MTGSAQLGAADQPSVFEHLNVLEDTAQGHVERFGELAHRRGAVAESRHDVDPGRVGESSERVGEVHSHSELIGSVYAVREVTRKLGFYDRRSCKYDVWSPVTTRTARQSSPATPRSTG